VGCDGPDCEKTCLADQCVTSVLSYAFDNWVTVAFTLLIAIWSMFVLDIWTRTLRTYQARWGLDSKFETDRPRGKFKGNAKRTNRLDNTEETFDTIGRVLARYFAAISTLVTMTAMLVIVYVAITVFRVFARIKLSAAYDSDLTGSLLAGLVASIFNLIFILALNDLYQVCAVKLTEWENHRTRVGHEDALVWKVFCE